MIYFLEMREELSIQELNDGIQPVLIRVAVNSKAEAVNKKPSFLQYFTGKSHKDIFHTCPHPKGSCTAEEI